jgi:hypothetical protein
MRKTFWLAVILCCFLYLWIAREKPKAQKPSPVSNVKAVVR